MDQSGCLLSSGSQVRILPGTLLSNRDRLGERHCEPEFRGIRGQVAAREAQLFQLWDSCGVKSAGEFGPGQLIQCLKRLEQAH